MVSLLLRLLEAAVAAVLGGDGTDAHALGVPQSSAEADASSLAGAVVRCLRWTVGARTFRVVSV